ncbi:hypothetical protein, partial [Candidatus Contendibacter odensensis]|uniref:hypothetical protein n=1 Tax=Candidatus Contendibacter odensensis TaxID=1400860 RepID=UPI0009DDEE98
MKFTQYFLSTRQRSDRASVKIDWIKAVVDNPVKEVIQEDGRIRRWASIPEANGKYLRVILLPDGITPLSPIFQTASDFVKPLWL